MEQATGPKGPRTGGWTWCSAGRECSARNEVQVPRGMIGLRDLWPEDKAMLLRWRNLPEVSRYMYTDHVITVEEHDRWFQGIPSDPTRRYWIITLKDEPVGLVNLYQIDSQNKRCYWAFYVAGENARGKGVGSFVEYTVLRTVFSELQLNKLCCEVLAVNTAVINMHRYFGFSEEGRLRQHIIKDGKLYEVVSMAILRKEWELHRPVVEERLRRSGIL
jgi:UDP-4-amino-4,6-dideoxy-N-acetyl-beta-L-altrosamine N-acetyltransferase